MINLEVKWRKHFLLTMKPQHLPALWSVNHQQERLGVKAAENRIDMEQYILATQVRTGYVEQYILAAQVRLGYILSCIF